MPEDLRSFIARVEREAPGEVVRVRKPISSRYEISALLTHLERRKRFPLLIFENVDGGKAPVVINVQGSRKLMGHALGCLPEDLAPRFLERQVRPIPPIEVPEGPVHEVAETGDEVDLTRLPIPLHFEVDAAPYITAGQLVARDPETGVDTTGFHRLMLKGKNRLGLSLHSRRRMYEFHRRAEARGEPLPAAITLGIHPVHYMGSMAYHYPPGVRKYEIIGALFGEPYRVSPCGIEGIEIPEGAEIVLEGEILNEVREPEGPFSEFTGYASYRSTENVFVVKRIQMRRDAMFHSVASGMSADHLLISTVSREAEILNTLRRNMPNVRSVHVPLITAGALMAVISMKKTAEGQPQQAIMAALGTEFYCKCVIVVDEDVDIFNLSDVMWAVITRTRAEKDIVFIPGAMGAILDPVSDAETHTLTKVGIDATKPAGRDFAERLMISEEQRARVRRILDSAGIRF